MRETRTLEQFRERLRDDFRDRICRKRSWAREDADELGLSEPDANAIYEEVVGDVLAALRRDRIR